MKSKGLDQLSVYVIAVLVVVLFLGEFSAMMAIASHECEGSQCIELVHGE